MVSAQLAVRSVTLVNAMRAASRRTSERCKAQWTEISHGKIPGTVHDAWPEEIVLWPGSPQDFRVLKQSTRDWRN